MATTVMKEKLKKRRTRKRRGELHNVQQPIALKSEDGEPEPVERGTHAPAGGGGSCGGVPSAAGAVLGLGAIREEDSLFDREINQPERGENERERVNSRD